MNYATHPDDQGCGMEDCCSYMPTFPGNDQNPYYEEDWEYKRRLAANGEPRCAKDGLLCGKPKCSYCREWSEFAEEWARRSIVDQLADLGRELVAESSVIERDRTRLEVA